jgi:hypothetical protein
MNLGFSLNVGGDWNILPQPNILFALSMKPFDAAAPKSPKDAGAAGADVASFLRLLQ